MTANTRTDDPSVDLDDIGTNPTSNPSFTDLIAARLSRRRLFGLGAGTAGTALLQACGGLSTYLQIVGRLLRTYEGKERAILQDHSGAWHRHGSPNADREWRLGETDRHIARRVQRSRQRGDAPAEPICCPKCQGIRAAGPKCSYCGHEHVRSIRMVRMTSGQLKKMQGPTVKRRKIYSDDERLWTSCLYAAAHSGHTLGQARGRFVQRAGKPFPDDLPHAPAFGSVDWDRRALDVYPWLGRGRGSKFQVPGWKQRGARNSECGAESKKPGTWNLEPGTQTDVCSLIKR